MMIRENYIDLGRTFYRLSKSAQTDEFDREFESTVPQFERGIEWDELIKQSRVIILSEAGSGKSSEIYHTAKALRAKKSLAFFIRIEDISSDLGFELGTDEEFNKWLASDELAWIFLDSVDEAKLSDPRDFSKAIRKFSRRIASGLNRAFIFITSRASSWSHKTDLAMCNEYLPENTLSEYDFSRECFHVYSLTDLDEDQVKKFLVANNVPDIEHFLVEAYRQEARMFTSRPQDLLELISYWKRHKSIGSKYQLIQDSIERRLEEPHETYSQVNPISKEKLRIGAEKIAVAMILTRKFTIKVPDGSNYSSGIDLKSILSDWDHRDCTTLLARPIFDDAIYGSVRFHHRSVREYLAARWFFNRLNNGSPRFPIENLFVKSQYGEDVIVPSVRHILPWLAQMDEKVRHRVIAVDPHAILEGGDPAMFPCHVREELFEKVCLSVHNKGSNWHFDNWESVKKMAKPDVADKINQLLNRFSDDATIVSLLMDSACYGGITECLAIARSIAIKTDLDEHARISAIKLIRDFDEDKIHYIRDFYASSERRIVGRSLANELIVGLPRDRNSLSWLLQILNSISDVDDYQMTGLTTQLIGYSNSLDLSLSADLGKGIRSLLSQEPFMGRGYCKISQKHSWLFDVALAIIERLLLSKSYLIFQSEFVELLVQVHPSRHYNIIRREHKIVPLINEWIEFKHYLFWQGIEEERQRLAKKDLRLRYHYQIRFLDGELRFIGSDLPLLLDKIGNEENKDNQTIALSVCLLMYNELGKPRKLLNSIKRAVGKDAELLSVVYAFFHPQKLSKEHRSLIAQDRSFKMRRAAHEKQEARILEEVVRKVKANPNQLRDPGLGQGVISTFQYYLYEKTQTKQNNEVNRWIKTDWRVLIEIIGENAAFAYRDGIMSFWRQHEPTWSADGKIELNKYLFFALAGVQIEADEIESWSDKLSNQEIVLVCKYAFANLNEFPSWFAGVEKKYPTFVSELIFGEIEREASLSNDSSTVIQKIFYHHKYLWESLADGLMVRLRENKINLNDVKFAIRILESLDQISDVDLAELAAFMCDSSLSGENRSVWYATWIGVDPDSAIKKLSEYLRSIEIAQDSQEFAMHVISSLIGTRGSGGPARTNFKNPKALKELIVLMYTYIKKEEDFERAGKGVYSPGLRDEAQDARNRLETYLKDIPGKESFSAMVELSQTHPHVPYRKWMASDAKERARIDSAFIPYSVNDFIEFCNKLERTPANHRELYELAVFRLRDLKADLEDGDNSYALNLISEQKETRVRNVIGGWCRDRSNNRYSIVQEEELADSKKPDLRFLGSTFDAPVPVELKLADRWSAEALIERLENQLCGDYLRDSRSNNGIYLLINQSTETWKSGDKILTFKDLINLLKSHWGKISRNYPKIDDIEIIGIDLPKRLS